MNTLIILLEKPGLWAGKASAWLLLLMMLCSCLVVVLRYGFSIGFIALQEAVNYLHATAFLLGCAYTLQQNEHVRVDIFYQRFNTRQKAWVDALGVLIFLLPFTFFLLFCGWTFFQNAWQIKESSPEPGGLAFLYLYKGLIPLAMLLIILQATELFLSCVNTLIFTPSSEG
ncbi:MAG: TRAP transporter small permease subunit [Pseudomonadales bacterium]|nr:TRAP transporter small permease subunit [Pseudomonadales bacterium]